LIIDTTYLLPLAKVGIDTDLLLAIAEKKTKLRLDEIGVSLISLFELQAKAAKLRVPADVVNNSTKAILETFTVIPFSDSNVVELSFRLREGMTDYIDCVIVGTAAAHREDLVTEDSKIWRARKSLRDEYGINVRRYKDIIG
jgi:predicted nucleic acid-binding protein